jgi:chorismate mutase/prephenate dehydrogenase
MNLDEIRKRLDEIDDRMLELLAERLGLVGQVAEVKKARGEPLFSREREKSVMRKTADRATRHGIPAAAAEGLMSAVVAAAHRTQEDLRQQIDPKTIAIVGGEGAMGTWFQRFFTDDGHRVLSTDVHTKLRPEEAVSQADLVMVAVPIRATEEVIRTIAPAMRSDAGIVDITSIKSGPVQAMLDAAPADVVGSHPMFGPSTRRMSRQRVILCPARGTFWFEWLKGSFERRGAEVTVATAEEHDRQMAFVQVLVHLITYLSGKTMHDMGCDIGESLRFTSPVYRMELAMTARHFAQNPNLYADIEFLHPRAQEIADALRSAADNVAQRVAAGDTAGFAAEFREIATYLGPFKDEAMAESDYLIRALVDRP